MEDWVKKLDEKVYHGAITKQRDKNEYGFKLENVKKITPIEINGALSFWEFPY